MPFGAIGSDAAGLIGRAKAIPFGAICTIPRPGGTIAICPISSLSTTSDLKADLAREIRRIADFLTIPLD